MITRLPAVLLVAALGVGYIAATTTRQEEVPPDKQDIPEIAIPPIPPTPTFPDIKPPPTDKTAWAPLMTTPAMSVELDGSSIKVLAVDNSFRVQSRMRLNFFNEIEVKDQEKKGAYYINTMSADCQKNTLLIDSSTVYTKEGEELATATDLGVLKNPKNPDSFITLWIAVVCKDLRGKKVPISI